MDIKTLETKVKNLRKNIISMIYAAQSGHPDGSLSAIDLLTTLFFGGYFNSNPKNPKDENRDYFILSKGHASPAYYAVLGEMGFFSKDEHFSFRQINSLLQGHPMPKIPGVEVASGSLGQGLSVANGIALALKLDKKENKVFVLIGDGELQEGQVWEAAMTSSHYNLDNLVVIVDQNGLQIDGATKDVMNVGNIGEKFKAFGFEVIELDGHNFSEIKSSFEKAISIKGKPCVLVANTIKGKGVSFMEGKSGWHGKAPNNEEFEEAKKELS